MSGPSTEDLRAVFDDLVGAPRPSGDLAERARRRGTALRRQRLGVVTAGVATVTVLVVPSVLAVRHDGSAGFGPGSSSTATATPAASAKAGVPEQNGTRADKQRAVTGSILGTPAKGPDADSYLVVEKAPTAQDTRRINAAAHLLGPAFTLSDSGVAMDAATGAEVGTSATFRAASGESVGIVWAAAATEKGTASSTAGKPGVTTSGGFGVGAAASGDPAAKDTVHTLGGTAVGPRVRISAKVVQPGGGAHLLTPDKVDALVTGLLAAES